jgi:hypothetical protein
MIKLILAVGALALVAGCSTSPKTLQSQYCYTDQVIVKNDSTVSSQTVLECTDRPSRQAEIARAGVDKNCEEFWYPEHRWGKTVQVRGVRCEKFNGSWEIININGNIR